MRFWPRFLYRTRLAMHLLFKERTRLVVALAGIAFADFLIFFQLGFKVALYDSTTRPQRALGGELVILNRHFESLVAPKSFLRDKLYASLAVPGVKRTAPLHMAFATWKNPLTRKSRLLFVMASDPGNNAFASPEVQARLKELQSLNRILFDREARPEFGPIAELLAGPEPVEVEVNQVLTRVVGLFSMGASFAADGTVIASDITFARMFPNHRPDLVESGLVFLEPGCPVEPVRAQLQARLGDEIKVLTLDEFAELEKAYWANSTGIGFIFGLGTAVGFVVGLVIVYQILHSDVTDHLQEYATLKAMGYSDAYLLGVIAEESLLLAVLGFIPGYLVTLWMYAQAQQATLLPVFMTQERAVAVFALTLAMCFLSGAVASRKLRAADPAEIFR